jgi:hypothetical protein
MAGQIIVLQILLHLKRPIISTVTSVEFLRLKVSKQFLQSLQSVKLWFNIYLLVCTIIPALRVLWLTDKQAPGMDKLYYYVRQSDNSLEESIPDLTKFVGNEKEGGNDNITEKVYNYFINDSPMKKPQEIYNDNQDESDDDKDIEE